MQKDCYMKRKICLLTKPPDRFTSSVRIYQVSYPFPYNAPCHWLMILISSTKLIQIAYRFRCAILELRPIVHCSCSENAIQQANYDMYIKALTPDPEFLTRVKKCS